MKLKGRSVSFPGSGRDWDRSLVGQVRRELLNPEPYLEYTVEPTYYAAPHYRFCLSDTRFQAILSPGMRLTDPVPDLKAETCQGCLTLAERDQLLQLCRKVIHLPPCGADYVDSSALHFRLTERGETREVVIHADPCPEHLKLLEVLRSGAVGQVEKRLDRALAAQERRLTASKRP